MGARFFVTATDTGVGKTEVAAALLEVLVAAEERPFAFKPYESGVKRWAAPADGLRLQRAGGGWQPLETVSLHRLRAPLAPGVAAELEGAHPSWERTLNTYADFGAGASVVVEGAGGLYVPLDEEHDVIDLIAALGLPVVVVARAGLGTINHTTLTVLALEERRQNVAAVVLVKAKAPKDVSEATNRKVLEARFPAMRILGPVPYVREGKKRSRAFRAALRPLV